MARPQQPELAGSDKTGPVPAENEPGHHPPEEQDKPDLDEFAARLGTDPEAATDASSDEREPRLVGLVLMPLRQTVKGLEQLDRMLSERLSQKLRARGGRGPKGR